MPKRGAEERMEYYRSKLKRLQDEQCKRRRRIVIFSDSSDADSNSDHENHEENINEDTYVENGSPHVDNEVEIPPVVEASTEEAVPAIDAELLTALGDTADDVPMYGEKIHPDLAQRWLPVLRKGIPKDNKDKLLKEYSIPENYSFTAYKLLRAPTLNVEISAAVTDVARGRDKKIEAAQQQLGIGISALNRAMTLLVTSDDKQNKVKAIKILSDGCRILSDLHYAESQARIKLITPGLDKAFTNVMQDFERDETLFGIKLSDKIKASKAIEKQGLQIKKGATTQRSATASTNTSQTPAPTRSRYQGNWTGPARFQPPNRGGRMGPQRTPAAARRSALPPAPQPRAPSSSRPRAAPRQ